MCICNPRRERYMCMYVTTEMERRGKWRKKRKESEEEKKVEKEERRVRAEVEEKNKIQKKYVLGKRRKEENV